MSEEPKPTPFGVPGYRVAIAQEMIMRAEMASALDFMVFTARDVWWSLGG